MLRHHVRSVVAVSIVAVSAAAVQGVAAREVAFGPDCEPVLTALEWRLLDMARADTGALRQFLFSRRAIYDLPIYETALWAERIGRQREECLRARVRTSTQASAPAAAARNR